METYKRKIKRVQHKYIKNTAAIKIFNYQFVPDKTQHFQCEGVWPTFAGDMVQITDTMISVEPDQQFRLHVHSGPCYFDFDLYDDQYKIIIGSQLARYLVAPSQHLDIKDTRHTVFSVYYTGSTLTISTNQFCLAIKQTQSDVKLRIKNHPTKKLFQFSIETDQPIGLVKSTDTNIISRTFSIGTQPFLTYAHTDGLVPGADLMTI